MRQAFHEAREGKPVVLAVTNHDFRDMRPDIEAVRSLLVRVAADFPDVPFRFSEAVDAMRASTASRSPASCVFDMSLRAAGAPTHVLEVESDTPTFGPQPWLALEDRAGTYHYDNFDIDVPFHQWRYVFDEETFPLRALDSIGVAANNAFGVTTVRRDGPSDGEQSLQTLERAMFRRFRDRVRQTTMNSDAAKRLDEVAFAPGASVGEALGQMDRGGNRRPCTLRFTWAKAGRYSDRRRHSPGHSPGIPLEEACETIANRNPIIAPEPFLLEKLCI